MAFEVFAFACFLAVASAGVIQPVHYTPQVVQYAAPAKVAYSAPAAQYAVPAKVATSILGYAAPAKVAYSAPQQQQYSHSAPQPHQYSHSAPQQQQYSYGKHEEQYAPAEYSFEYSVHDEKTGDINSQKETRNGDKVEGYYTMIEADGTRRIVEYIADEHSGFNALVRHEGASHGAAKTVQAAPQYSHSAPSYTLSSPSFRQGSSQGSYSQTAPAYKSYTQAAPFAQVQSYNH